MNQNSTDNPPLIHRLISTTFGCGYWPWGPGTAGAVGGLVAWLVILAFVPSATAMTAITLGLIVVFTALGVWSATVAEKYWGPDPSRVVMDETVGQWISMLPICSYAGTAAAFSSTGFWLSVVFSLILFRFFDIVKPLGVRAAERLPRGWGVMADDILAGVYSFIILGIALWL